jgi:hypothetical protein
MKTMSFGGVLCAGLLTLALTADAQQAAPGGQAVQRTFETAQQAADALIAAAEQGDVAALEALFGPKGRDLVTSGDAVQDKTRLQEFVTKAREKKTVTPDPKNKDRAVLSVGNDDWPLPVPIVRKGGKWAFDAAAGREEIRHRVIGGNELDAIEICRGFVEAQHEYAHTKRDGVNQYAQRIISTPGKQDGLAWRNADGSWNGPVGENVARAIEQGYSDRGEPFHGYFFKVLKGQGPAAPLGQLDYVVKGVMIGGFALVAAPAQYGVSGIQTFMVSNDGVVYEKDLGADTLKVFKAMERFNPDKTWNPVDER